MTRFLIWNGCLWNFIVGFPQINFDIFFSLQNVIVLDLSQDISSTTTSTTTTTATTESPIGVGNNVLSGKTNTQTKNEWMVFCLQIVLSFCEKKKILVIKKDKIFYSNCERSLWSLKQSGFYTCYWRFLKSNK